MTRGWQAKLAGVNQHQRDYPRHPILILIVARPNTCGVTITQQSSTTGGFSLIVARHPLARVNQRRASINKRLPASINIGIIISAATFSTCLSRVSHPDCRAT
ncbi:hypothetical protein M3I54_44085, partial [Paraburkholderia sp. CNPSo 3274]|uniref:hypothetical protein n=1 Tax=Paraburkholderia sp. CNPSo 3274 TaxID=2940932 RepID=UPI0020B889AA